MAILILTGYDDAMAEVGDLTNPSKAAFAEAGGYAFHCQREYTTDSHPSWQKIALLRRYLPEFDAILWLDADSLVTSTAFRVNQSRSLGTPLIVSRDWSTCSPDDEPHHFSMGNFLIRNVPNAFRLLDLVEARQSHWMNQPLWEQSAIQAEHRENPKVRNWIHVVPRRVLNSVPHPEAPEPWRPGDFLCHYTGIANSLRIALIHETLAKIGQ
jgi:hypothetical protein